MGDPLILPKERKHGIPDDDLLHADRNPLHVWDFGDNGQMSVGPAADGTLLEVGVTQGVDHPDALVTFHGMTVGPAEVPAPEQHHETTVTTDAQDVARAPRPRGRHVGGLR